MKGEILERAKHVIPDTDESAFEISWQFLHEEIEIEFILEALNLIGLYIILRIVEHMLLIAEYIFVEVENSPIEMIDEIFGQGMKVTDEFFEKEKSQLWQISRVYHVLETEINVLKSLIVDSKNSILLYRSFIQEPDCTSAYPLVPHITEALTSSYCC